MRQFLLLSLTLLSLKFSYAQDTAVVSVPQSQDSTLQLQNSTGNTFQTNERPVVNESKQGVYTTKFKTDAPIIVAGLGLSYLGLKLIDNKKPLTAAEVASKSKDNVPFFDRSNAGWYSDKANDDSYAPFYFSFGAPIALMLINKNERSKAGQVLVMYTETMAITATMFTVTAGLIHRSRPLVYGNEAPIALRMSAKSQRSFYAGHTASSAAATFFAAKVFQDLNPDSKAKALVWTVAAIVPASVGYLRYRAGMHFLSDNVLGYVIGAATGILVPQFHKNKRTEGKLSLSPAIGGGYHGFSMTYRF